MKVRHSLTPIGEKRTDRDLANQWETIDWEKTESLVNRLQTRIAKATQEGKNNLLFVTALIRVVKRASALR